MIKSVRTIMTSIYKEVEESVIVIVSPCCAAISATVSRGPFFTGNDVRENACEFAIVIVMIETIDGVWEMTGHEEVHKPVIVVISPHHSPDSEVVAGNGVCSGLSECPVSII